MGTVSASFNCRFHCRVALIRNLFKKARLNKDDLGKGRRFPCLLSLNLLSKADPHFHDAALIIIKQDGVQFPSQCSGRENVRLQYRRYL